MASLTDDSASLFPAPEVPTQRFASELSPAVKIARPDIMINDSELVPPEVMAALTFEDLAANELIDIVRNDTVNGQDIVYSPIRNLSSLAIRYSPQNLVALQNTSKSYFENFPLKLEEYIPTSGLGVEETIVYIDPTTRNLIVNVVNLNDDERVEVQILTSGSLLDDTIYTEGI